MAEDLARRENVNIVQFEAGDVLIAADECIDACGSSEGDELVIVTIAADGRALVWIINELRMPPEGRTASSATSARERPLREACSFTHRSSS